MVTESFELLLRIALGSQHGTSCIGRQLTRSEGDPRRGLWRRDGPGHRGSRGSARGQERPHRPRPNARAWLGEIEGLKVSLAGTEDTLTQIDGILPQQATTTQLGTPTFADRTTALH